MAPPRLKAIRQSALGLSEPQYPPQPLWKYWPVHPVLGSCSTNRAFEATVPVISQEAGSESVAATSAADVMWAEASARLEKSWSASSLHGRAAAIGSAALLTTNRLRSTRFAICAGTTLTRNLWTSIDSMVTTRLTTSRS